eukprot:Lankesteria_metandrocarpae@DN4066_c0_g1_i1.p1
MLVESVQRGLERVAGKVTADLLRNSKILVVGAGGVGCELLKNLVMMGVGQIDCLDLDTIDISNLNRQFLFRREHVGLQKSTVARDAVSHYSAVSSVTAHFGDVKDMKFGTKFFEQFDVVLNALDNTSARRHVNRLCLAASVPLIEAGSTGHLGQALPILGRLTECYECSPPARHKSFPVCTIRSLPEKQEHCIAWAKYLFELLFGPKTDTNVLADLLQDFKEASTASTDTADAARTFAHKISNALFVKDIKAQANLPGAWEARKPPVPVELDTSVESEFAAATGSTSPTGSDDSFRVWSSQEAVHRFINAIVQMKTDRAEDCGKVVFDKDDPLAVEFVTAAACVRMTNFHMQRMSKWKVESIAGAIVPAIASTNAIVAGLQTAQLLHVLRWRAAQRDSKSEQNKAAESTTDSKKTSWTENEKIPDEIRLVWVYKAPSGRHILRSTTLEAPNRKCYVCQSIRMAITLNSLKEWRLIDFVNKIVKKELGCSEPLVELSSSQKCIYDEEMEYSDAGTESMLTQSLEEWELSAGDILMITDLSQDFQFDATVLVEEMDEKSNPDLFRVEHLSGERQPDAAKDEDGAQESDDGLEEVSEIETEPSGNNDKDHDLEVVYPIVMKSSEDVDFPNSSPPSVDLSGARKRCRYDEVIAEAEIDHGSVPEPKKPRTVEEESKV